MKSIVTRTASGAGLMIAIAAATMWCKWSFGVLLLVITIGCVIEFNKMSRRLGYNPLTAMNIASAVAIFAFSFDGFFNSSELSIPIGLFVISLIPLTFVVELFNNREGSDPIVNIALTLMPLLYIVLPISLLAGIPIQICDGVWVPQVMFLYIIVVWSNDIFAYLFGITCGRHYLCEKISPKKTWEGFIGGVIGSVVVAIATSYVLEQSVALWIGVAIIATITGVLGDLVESMFKRSVHVKDSGSLLPGHGGWLDRFDSLILSAPFVFVYLLIVSMF